MNQAEAEKLFAEGKSINAVATALKISWYDASKLKKEYDKLNGIEPKAKKAPEPTESEPVVDEEADYIVELAVPTGRLDDLFAAFTTQEKANAIAGVLQARLDASLNVGEEEAA